MPDIRLRDYVAKIKDLVRTNLEDEAIAHCQHILHQYPKHVETYCLLGEACLEKRMYREAIEFFQRTLSADPENLIARVGLGVIYDEQGAIAEAIWQMEQAFELAPGNTEVRRELQRLYSQRDGREKSRLKLTRGALGRLYVRNGLYERALGEFRAVLRQDPDLPSIRVSLIEALWREGRRLEAVETCLDLLEALPYCLKANLILGEIWLRGGNEEAGQEKLDVARALDPENLIAQELMGRNSPLPTEEVLIDELEVTATMLSAFFGEEEQVAEAGEGIEEAFAAEVEEAWGEQEEVPDWLEAMGLTETAQAALLEAGEEEALPEELPPVEEIPDWLKELGVSSTEEAPAVLEEEEPAAPEAEVATTLEEEALAALEEEMLAAQEEVAATAEEAEAEPVAEAPAEVLGEVSVGEPAPAEEIETAEVTEEEIPDWLRELERPEVEGEGPPPVAEEVAEEALEAWEEETPEAIAEEEPTVLQAEIPVALEEEGPVVLEEAPVAEQAEAALEEEPAAEAAPVAEVPESLRALVEAGILDEADLETAMAEMSAEDLEAQREEAVPDWLQELMGEEAAAPEEELAAEEEPVAEEEAEAEPVAEAPAEISGEPSGEEPAPAEEIPDWLRELGEPVAAAEIETAEMPEEEIPEWLGELETPEVEEEGPLPVAEEVAKEEEQEEPIAVAGEAVEAPEAEVPAVAEAAPAEEVELEAEEAVPEWLQELMGEEASLAEEESAESAAEAQEEAAGERVPAEEVPGWLLELEELEAEEEVSEEIPQWLREFQVPDTEDLVPPSAEQAPSVEAAAPEAESMAEEHEVEAGAPGWLQELMVEETAAVEEQELSPVAEAEEEVAAEPEAVSGEAEASQAEVPEAIVSEPEIPEAEEPTAEKAAPPAGMEMKAPLDRISVEKVETVPKTEEPTGMSVPTATPATEKEMVAPFDRVEVEEKVSAPPRIEELLAHLQSKPRDYRARMELARIYSVEKDWTAALKQYEKLISARKLLPAVIEELEALRQEQVDEIRLFQLLGDAYMQDDQLDKALEMYRLARQALAKR
jgi:tetratricopeptide (TPR) repeat protein